MSKSEMKPDFGVFYLKTFGTNTTFKPVDYTIFNISCIGNDLYTSSNNLIYGGIQYCMTVDFNAERLKELISCVENPVVKTYLEQTLLSKYKEPIKADLSGSPIQVMLSAELGAPITNENETYIPFIANKFERIDYYNPIEKLCIPDKITHAMVNYDEPVGFAIEYSGDEDDEVDSNDDGRAENGGGGGNGGNGDEEDDYAFEDDDKDPNILEAYVCYPDSPSGCEWGSVYTYSNFEEAEKSFAWKVMGGFNYAVPVQELNSSQIMFANSLWKKHEKEFREGFGKFKLGLK